jgi:hypothetical protein
MKTWLRLTLITMTVGGGFAGVVFASQTLFTSHGQKPLNLLVMVGFIALFAYVTVSGLMFVNDPQRTRHLIVALAIQIPWISSPFLVYKFATGFHAVLGIASPEGMFGIKLEASALLGSSFLFALGQDNPWSMGINVFALVMLILLHRSIQMPGPAAPPPTAASVEPHSPEVPGLNL